MAGISLTQYGNTWILRMLSRRLQAQLIVGVAVLVFSGGIVFSGGQVQTGWLRFFGAAVFASVLLLGAWERFLWRVPLIQRFSSTPDLNGTWKGQLVSFWTDSATNRRVPPKRAFLVVRQTASTISVVWITNESMSRSFMAEVAVRYDVKELNYMFVNSPDAEQEHRHHMHRGAAHLIISGQPVSKLQGRYWTDRQTKGEMVLTERHARYADDYEAAKALFRSGTSS